jgi:MFS family permease
MAQGNKTEAAQHDPYAALRYSDFRLLVGGQFLAQLGEMMVSVGIGWELYNRTDNALALGLVGLAQVLPVILLSVPSGYIVDRFNRKRVMLIAQAVLMVCSLILAYISATSGSLPLLYGILAVMGAARAFNTPAEGALFSQTIPAEHYYSAATWNTSAWQLSSIIGPGLGGLIIGVTNHAASVYAFNAFAAIVLMVALLFMRSKQTSMMKAEETPMQSIRAGLSFVRRTEVILASITLDMFAVLFGGAVTLLPVFAKDILRVDAGGLGILRAAPAVGALLMATTLARRPPFRKAGRTLFLAVAGFGVATIVFGLSTSFLLSIVMLFILGALDNISVVIRHSLVLIYTPDEMRGRVGAVNNVFIGTSNELGGFESGVVAALIGPVGAVIFGGIGTIVVVGLIAWLSPQLRRLGVLGESAQAAENDALVEVVTVESSIP